jgi:hypothetical protein
MAVVESLGRLVVAGGTRGGALRGRRISWIAIAAVLAVAPIVRAAEVETVEWVAPASLDAAPVRAMEMAPDPAVPEIAPKPIVVPLPSGLETGGAFLAALGAARWWSSARRRRT